MKCFQLFNTEFDVSCGLLVCTFIMLRVCSSAQFRQTFYHKWMLNFVRRFFCIYWDNHMICILPSFLIWYITLICRYLTILAYIHWNKSHLITVCDPFLMYCWIPFAKIFVEDFACWPQVILDNNFFMCDISVWF